MGCRCSSARPTATTQSTASYPFVTPPPIAMNRCAPEGGRRLRLVTATAGCQSRYHWPYPALGRWMGTEAFQAYGPAQCRARARSAPKSARAHGPFADVVPNRMLLRRLRWLRAGCCVRHVVWWHSARVHRLIDRPTLGYAGLIFTAALQSSIARSCSCRWLHRIAAQSRSARTACAPVRSGRPNRTLRASPNE